METTEIFIFFNSDNYFWSGACCKELIWALRLEKAGKLKIIEVKVHANTKINEFDNCKIYVNLNDLKLIEKLWLGITKNEFGGFESSPWMNLIENVDDKNIEIKLNFLKTFSMPSIFILWPFDSEWNFSDFEFKWKGFEIAWSKSEDVDIFYGIKCKRIIYKWLNPINLSLEYKIKCRNLDKFLIGFHSPDCGFDQFIYLLYNKL